MTENVFQNDRKKKTATNSNTGIHEIKAHPSIRYVTKSRFLIDILIYFATNIIRIVQKSPKTTKINDAVYLCQQVLHVLHITVTDIEASPFSGNFLFHVRYFF